MATDQDELARELERVLRRVRSTGDIDLERPSRQRGSIRVSVDRATGQRNLHYTPPDNDDTPHRRLSTPATAHTRDSQTRTITIPLTLDPPQNPPPRNARRRPPRPVPPGIRGKVLVFFGLAGPNSKARSQLISIVWKLAFSFVQYVIIITLLAFSAHHQSPTVPGMSEWQACSKPLGAWDCIWLVRVALGCSMGYWDWRRNVTLDRMERGGNAAGDAEAGRAGAGNTNRRGASNLTAAPNAQGQDSNAQTETPLPHNHAFRRLNILTNALSMVWFLAAHIFVYSSVNTCRHSSPHLWWLSFGILCILYLMLLEIFLLGLLIFILGPILYLFYNIVLLCLGRHPLQRAGEVHADIKKIPKSVVDKIPLVLYIPAPPSEDETLSKGSTSPITVPTPAHIYPPNSPITTTPTKSTTTEHKRKFRFAFFRRSKPGNSTSKGKGSKGKSGDSTEETHAWEDAWVPGDYPFVRLEGHRAACAICLMDFDEPERKEKSVPQVDVSPASTPPSLAQEKSEGESGGNASTQPELSTIQEVEAVQVEEVTQADAERLKLEDAGEGPQPLRLLACGHVFHKICVDPWLIDVSGRCPVCQRPVEIPESTSKKERRRGRRADSTNTPP